MWGPESWMALPSPIRELHGTAVGDPVSLEASLAKPVIACGRS